jgi:hypothetical protein
MSKNPHEDDTFNRSLQDLALSAVTEYPYPRATVPRKAE